MAKKMYRIDVFEKDCVPIIGSEYSAGFDVRANIKSGFNSENLDILPGEIKHIPTGLKIYPLSRSETSKHHMFVACKSGLCVKQGLWVGEHSNNEQLWIKIINTGKSVVSIKHGQPIAQIVVASNTCVNGFDFLCLLNSVNMKSNEQMLLPVAFDYHLRSGQCGIISSLAIHDKLSLFPGVIDSDYRGELKTYCMNESKDSVFLQKGSCVAIILQLNIINYFENFDIIIHSDSSSQSKQFEIARKVRGTGGFGSTS